jgi:hypothetical protein
MRRSGFADGVDYAWVVCESAIPQKGIHPVVETKPAILHLSWVSAR